MKKILKIIFISLISIILVCFLIILGLNIFKREIYPKYYEIKEDLAVNPGLGDGYVPNSVTSFERDGKLVYLTCGYMNKNIPSRVYIIDGKNTTYFNILDENDELVYSELEGITVYYDNVIVSSLSSLYILSLDDMLEEVDDDDEKQELSFNSLPNNQVKAVDTIELEIRASFLHSNSVDNYLYVGEDIRESTKGVHVNNNANIYSAKIRAYYLPDLLNHKLNIKANYIVRDEVKGMAIGNDKLVLVTSSGFSSSHIYVYDLPKTYDDGNTYYLDDRYLLDDIKAPILATGLDFINDRFVTLFASASNKYFIGKFFFANKIVGLDIE